MAIFSKNANRAALFGKQKLFKACCTPEVEECCYLTNPVPRPPAPPDPPCQECGRNIKARYLVNNVEEDFPIVIDVSELPAVIEVFFENGNPECDATFGKITSDSGNPNISIITYSPDKIGPLDEELIATIQLNTILGIGNYSPSLFFNLCNDPSVLNVDIKIEDSTP
jgi:hypothetical protein